MVSENAYFILPLFNLTSISASLKSSFKWTRNTYTSFYTISNEVYLFDENSIGKSGS